MAEKKFLYADPISGDLYNIREASTSDTVANTVPTSALAAPHSIAVADAAPAIVNLPIAQDTLIGRDGASVISSLTTTEVKDMLNVQDGATRTNGRQLVADDTANNLVSVYRDRDGSPFPDTLNFRTVSVNSDTRMVVDLDGTDKVQLDCLEVPHVHQVYGNGRIVQDNLMILVGASQRMRIIDAAVQVNFNSTPTGDERFTFRMFKNTTPDLVGATVIIDCQTYANGVTHLDGDINDLSSTGYIEKGDTRWKAGDYDSGSTTPVLNTGEWLFYQVNGKYVNSIGGPTSGDIEWVHMNIRFGYV